VRGTPFVDPNGYTRRRPARRALFRPDSAAIRGDCRKCQTATAVPAKPGGTPNLLERIPFGWDRHCEEPHSAAHAPRYGDEAIQAIARAPYVLLDCSAALAMTALVPSKRDTL
jgi:hypothetical protein